MAYEHSPGPWTHRRPNQIDRRHRVFSGDDLIALIDPHFGPDEVDSNGILIAAAPELLAALKAQLAYEAAPTGTGRLSWMELVKVRDAALAKAEGRS